MTNVIFIFLQIAGEMEKTVVYNVEKINESDG